MKSYICNRLKGLRSLSLESCLSGRKDLFAKQAYGELYQGFESLTLRFLSFSGCSVARLSRLLWEQEAAGSNPATPTKRSSRCKTRPPTTKRPSRCKTRPPRQRGRLVAKRDHPRQRGRLVAKRDQLRQIKKVSIPLKKNGGIAQLDRAPAF